MPSYRLLSWLVYPLISKGENKMNKTAGKWTPILETVSSLGPIAEIYAKTLAYKIETKRLEVELTRIEKQANVMHDVIDKSFKLEIGRLELKRLELVDLYQTVNGELQKQHIRRETVLKMAQLAQQKSFESGLSIEERRVHSEAAIKLIKQVRLFGDEASKTLQELVKPLPPVKIPPKLLDG